MPALTGPGINIIFSINKCIKRPHQQRQRHRQRHRQLHRQMHHSHVVEAHAMNGGFPVSISKVSAPNDHQSTWRTARNGNV